ncbi:hypothetical protein PENTCL1PPCAC_16183, partial [Pristionchus entomophagus]
VQLLTSLSYSIGIIGTISNAVLIHAIRKHTPPTLRVYAAIFVASALCDCIGLLAMMSTTAREVIYNGSCVLEFYGACTLVSDELCWACWGIQEDMYSTAVSLLCLSFVYRFHAIDDSKISRLTTVIVLCFGMVVINLHVVPGYYFTLSNARKKIAFMEDYITHRPDASTTLGLIYSDDLFSTCVTSYTILSGLLCFFIIVQLRKRTIQRVAMFEGTMSTNTKTHQMMLSKVHFLFF